MLGIDHVNYFSRKTLSRLLNDHGITVTRFVSSFELKYLLLYVILPFLKRRTKSKSDWTGGERQQAFNRLTARPRWMQRVLLMLHNALYHTMSALSIGDEMIVVAQKAPSRAD